MYWNEVSMHRTRQIAADLRLVMHGEKCILSLQMCSDKYNLRSIRPRMILVQIKKSLASRT